MSEFWRALRAVRGALAVGQGGRPARFARATESPADVQRILVANEHQQRVPTLAALLLVVVAVYLVVLSTQYGPACLLVLLPGVVAVSLMFAAPSITVLDGELHVAGRGLSMYVPLREVEIGTTAALGGTLYWIRVAGWDRAAEFERTFLVFERS